MDNAPYSSIDIQTTLHFDSAVLDLTHPVYRGVYTASDHQNASLTNI